MHEEQCGRVSMDIATNHRRRLEIHPPPPRPTLEGTAPPSGQNDGTFGRATAEAWRAIAENYRALCVEVSRSGAAWREEVETWTTLSAPGHFLTPLERAGLVKKIRGIRERLRAEPSFSLEALAPCPALADICSSLPAQIGVEDAQEGWESAAEGWEAIAETWKEAWMEESRSRAMYADIAKTWMFLSERGGPLTVGDCIESREEPAKDRPCQAMSTYHRKETAKSAMIEWRGLSRGDSLPNDKPPTRGAGPAEGPAAGTLWRWMCDACGAAEFETFAAACAHEATCRGDHIYRDGAVLAHNAIGGQHPAAVTSPVGPVGKNSDCCGDLTEDVSEPLGAEKVPDMEVAGLPSSDEQGIELMSAKAVHIKGGGGDLATAGQQPATTVRNAAVELCGDSLGDGSNLIEEALRNSGAHKVSPQCADPEAALSLKEEPDALSNEPIHSAGDGEDMSTAAGQPGKRSAMQNVADGPSNENPDPSDVPKNSKIPPHRGVSSEASALEVESGPFSNEQGMGLATPKPMCAAGRRGDTVVAAEQPAHGRTEQNEVECQGSEDPDQGGDLREEATKTCWVAPEAAPALEEESVQSSNEHGVGLMISNTGPNTGCGGDAAVAAEQPADESMVWNEAKEPGSGDSDLAENESQTSGAEKDLRGAAASGEERGQASNRGNNLEITICSTATAPFPAMGNRGLTLLAGAVANLTEGQTHAVPNDGSLAKPPKRRAPKKRWMLLAESTEFAESPAGDLRRKPPKKRMPRKRWVRFAESTEFPELTVERKRARSERCHRNKKRRKLQKSLNRQ